jgi:cytidyltransferase-like protein
LKLIHKLPSGSTRIRLHAGHVSCLERSRQHGDMFIVGLNSDPSVQALKVPTRPAISHDYRAALLTGLAWSAIWSPTWW